MQLHELESRLADALRRIERLEEEVHRLKGVPRWQHLVARPHPWRRQLSIQGRNLTVGQLVSSIRANRLTPEQGAADYDLPLAAVQEALAYYDENRELIAREAAEERRQLHQGGCPLEPEDRPR